MDEFAALKADIQRELENLNRLSKEMEEVITKAPESTVIMARAAGSVLHDFYTGVEKVFRRIAIKVDRDLPEGEDWHIHLLQRMAVPVPKVRPHVIDKNLESELEEYLRFRHLFRNIYGFDLKWKRFQPLVKKMGKILQELERQIKNFEDFLASINQIG